MLYVNSKSSVESLLLLSIDAVLLNLHHYRQQELEEIKALPPNIKNVILKKFTASLIYARKIDHKKLIDATANAYTISVDLALLHAGSEVLEILKICKNMRRFYLSNQNFEESSSLLSLLPNLRKLQLIDFTRNLNVTDEVLQAVAEHCLLLEGISVSGCTAVTDDGIVPLANIQNLTSLDISHTQLTDNGLASLLRGENAKKIKELRIKCRNITEDGMRVVYENCSSLEVLSFWTDLSENANANISNVNLKQLKQLTWNIKW